MPTGEPWLPFGDDADTRNVASQRDDPASLLTEMRGISIQLAPPETEAELEDFLNALG